MYYLTAKADKYISYKSDVFPVSQDITVHMDIELKKTTWLSIFWNWLQGWWKR